MYSSQQKYRIIIAVLFVFLVVSGDLSAKTWRIMAVGNSITKGTADDVSPYNGYRDHLFNILTRNNLAFTMVGPDGSAPLKGLFQGGAKIEWFFQGGTKDLAQAIQQYQPNLLIIHLGTNNTSNAPNPYSVDGGRTLNEDTASGKLAKLLKIALSYPVVERVIMSKIPPKVTYEGFVSAFNSELDRIFFENPAGIPTRTRVTVANTVLSAGDIVDGIHPGDRGYQKMAEEFSRIIIGLNRSEGTPPGQIVWGPVNSLDGQTVGLQWIAPGDDGYSGRANLYELRYSLNELTSSNFRSGKLVSLGRPQIAGGIEQAFIQNLIPGTRVYLGIRAYDEQNNTGPTSLKSVTITEGSGNTFCDNFTNADSSNEWWSFDPCYSTDINRGELSNNCPTSGWNALAVFKKGVYDANAKSVDVSVNWAEIADEDGMYATGVAMMLNSDSHLNASGYMITLRFDTIYLYEIVNSSVNPDKIHYYRLPRVIKPFPGDSIQVEYAPSYTLGHTFTVSLNDQYLGQVYDTNRRQGNAEKLYSGVLQYGGRNNTIEKFCIMVPPLDPHSMSPHAGENQRGRVTEKLPEPVSVKVLDVNGVGVPDIPVDFDVTEGDAILLNDSLFNDFTGDLWIEAESGDLGPIFREGNSLSASGNKYIYVPVSSNVRDEGTANYKVYTPKGGTYYFYIRAYAPDGNQNSCYLELGQNSIRVDFNEYRRWFWYKTDHYIHLDDQEFAEFGIRNREPGTQIDKILLSRHNNWNLDGNSKGGETQRFPNITDRAGIAYTEVRFTENAGLVRVEAYAPSVPNNNKVDFTIFADALDPTTIIALSPRVMTGKAGMTLQDSFKVSLEDKFGNQCAGVQVEFNVIQGDGHFNDNSSTVVSSDAQGNAAALLTMGYHAEQSTITASLPDYPAVSPITFEAVLSEKPVEIVKLRGDEQTGVVKTTLPAPIEIKILNGEGNPFAGYKVPFRVKRNNGLLNNQSVFVAETDANGIASVQWTLGDSAGVNSDMVIIDEKDVPLNGAPVTFRASALPDDPVKLVKLAGDIQQQHAGLLFNDSLTIKVADQFDNGIPDYELKFTRVQGDGYFNHSPDLTSITIKTNQNGLAVVGYVAGSSVGIHQVKVEGVPPLPQGFILFTNLNVLEPKASKIQIVSGDNQSTTVGGTLPEPIVVKITDPFDSPITGEKVWFKVIQGGGKVEGQDSLFKSTDSNGLAKANFTLGTQAGIHQHRLEIYLEDTFIPSDTVNASGLPAAANSMEVIGETEFSAKPESGPIKLGVIVYDAFGNVKPYHDVIFMSEHSGTFDGNATYKKVTTNMEGKALVDFYMGSNSSKDEEIIARSFRQDNSNIQLQNSPITFIGHYLPGEPSKLVKVSGDNQQGMVSTTLDSPLVVQVLDDYGMAIQNIKVRFKVTAGSGTIGSLNEFTTTTDKNGLASVYLTVGKIAGSLVNQVRITLVNYADVVPVSFRASTTPGPADRLLAETGRYWESPVGSVVNPAVKVADAHGNTIQEYPVTWRIIRGQGKVNNQDSIRILTNENGLAQIDWQLGATPDTNIVQAMARADSPLTNSPIDFRAYGTASTPYYIELVSAPRDTGIVGDTLFTPIQVKVLDRFSNPVYDHPVTFEIKNGNAYFVQTGTEKITKNSERDGIVSTRVVLGNKVTTTWIQISSQYNSTLLVDRNNPGSPSITVGIEAKNSTAQKIRLLSENQITNRVGSITMVQVVALDKNDNPVSAQPVYFETLDEYSSLGADQNKLLQRITNSSGIVQVPWQLGTVAGENVNSLRIRAEDNVGPLENSPITVNATVLPGTPSADLSEITAQSPIPTDGDSKSRVEITIRDSYQNAIEQIQVLLSMTGEDNVIENPAQKTDSEGKTVGFVKSQKSGQKTISALIAGNTGFSISTTVEFLPGPASDLQVSGNNQQGNPGTVLPNPIVALAVDDFGNPVPNVSIIFQILSGNGKLMENMAEAYSTHTDSSGKTHANWILGPEMNKTNRLNITSNDAGLSDVNKIVSATTAMNTPNELRFASDSTFITMVGDTLQDTLAVQVLDATAHPISGIPVNFIPVDNDGVIIWQSEKTDYEGHSFAIFKSATKVGNHQVKAAVSGLNKDLIFSIQSGASYPSAIEMVSGNGQTGTVKQSLQRPLVVGVKDRFGNPTPDIPIVYKVTEGIGGYFAESDTAYTWTNGQVYKKFTPGEKAGEYVIKVFSPQVPNTQIYFSCTAKSGEAHSIEIVSGNNQRMTIGRELLNPCVVRVNDAYGNPVSNYQTIFAALSGRLVNESDMTDENGHAECRWILSANPGIDSLYAGFGLHNPVYFYAVGETNQYPVFVDMPSDTTINYNDYLEKNFELNINVHDDDGDVLQVEAKGLPEGATFDAENLLLTWRPKAIHKGKIYPLEFKVYDSQGGMGLHTLNIRVDGNTAPVILTYNPVDQNVSVQKPESIKFSVSATDADPDDRMNFTWYVDHVKKKEGSEAKFMFNSLEYNSSTHEIKVVVSDGKSSTEMSWSIIVTAVELSLFQAMEIPYTGIKIEWQTRSEQDNIGFNVLKSRTKNGRYMKINDNLIPSNNNGQYVFIDSSQVTSGHKYFYKLEDLSSNASRHEHGPIMVLSALPNEFKVLQNYPNPFNPETSIRFQLPSPQNTQITIFNLTGQQVRTLVHRKLEPGYHQVKWDGKNEHGIRVSSGLYYYRIQAGQFKETRKMALIK